MSALCRELRLVYRGEERYAFAGDVLFQPVNRLAQSVGTANRDDTVICRLRIARPVSQRRGCREAEREQHQRANPAPFADMILRPQLRSHQCEQATRSLLAQQRRAEMQNGCRFDSCSLSPAP